MNTFCTACTQPRDAVAGGAIGPGRTGTTTETREPERPPEAVAAARTQPASLGGTVLAAFFLLAVSVVAVLAVGARRRTQRVLLSLD